MKLPELKELPTQDMVERLTAERDAALAQVEQLRTEWEKKDGSDITESDKLELLVAIIYKTPAQCLTEIKAQAIEEASDHVGNLLADKHGIVTTREALDILNHKSDVVLCFTGYANQLRQAAKGGE